jgi:hypothetical protein
VSALVLTAQDVTTLLLGLDLVESYAAEQIAQARRVGNVVKAAAMQAMPEHVADLRSRIHALRK